MSDIPAPEKNSFAFNRDGVSPGTKPGLPAGELLLQGELPSWSSGHFSRFSHLRAEIVKAFLTQEATVK